jgi:hypothetical protein
VFALAFGLLLDAVYSTLGIDPASVVGTASEVLPDQVKLGFAVVLAVMMAYALYVRRQAKACSN